jgi:hypothetical protein
MLLAMWRVRDHPFIYKGLTFTAAFYFAFSFLPWIFFLLVHGI